MKEKTFQIISVLFLSAMVLTYICRGIYYYLLMR